MRTKAPVWQLSPAELASGRLISADCILCKGTGLIEDRYGQETCQCVDQAQRAFEQAAFPERFDQQTLATLDWDILQPAELVEPIRAYAQSLVDYREDGIGLVLFGQPGNGKTHVSVGIGKIACALGYSVAFITVADWLEALRASYDGPDTNHGNGGQRRNGHADVFSSDFAILDDLGLESETAWVREKIYQITNRRWLAQLPTLVTTNRDPDELARRYGEGVISRLWGSSLVLHFTGDDYRQSQKSQRLSRLRSLKEVGDG